MKKYKVNVNGTVYEIAIEAMDGAAPVAAAPAPAWTALNTGQAAVTSHRSSRQEMVLQATSRAFTPRASRKRNIYWDR